MNELPTAAQILSKISSSPLVRMNFPDATAIVGYTDENASRTMIYCPSYLYSPSMSALLMAVAVHHRHVPIKY